MRQLWTMTASDLRQRVRDKSVIIFALVVPLALMFVFNLVFGGAQDFELESVTVAASAPEGDELAGVVVGVLDDVDFLDVSVEEVPAGDVRPLAEAGDAHLGIVIPEGFGDAVTSGEPVAVEIVEGDGAGIETDVLLSVVQSVLDQFAAGTVAATAGAQLGLPHDQLGRIAQEVAEAGPDITLAQGATSDEQLGGAATLVAGQAGLFLMFTVGFGVLGLLYERENGTLARLRSMPMRPGLIVVAKGLVSFTLGTVATAVLLTVGSLFFDVSFGSPLTVAVLILCVVAATTSLMFMVARVAKTAEQASIAQSILALVLGMTGGAFFPITATGALAQVLDLNPIAAFTRGLGITAGGGGLADVGTPVIIMLGFALVCGVLSRAVPDRGIAL